MSSATSPLRSDAIPDALRARRQWVTWRYETRASDPKPTKVPYSPRSGNRASTTDPSAWSTFAEALTAAARYDGIGFVFTEADPYFGVDLDGCLDPDTGAIDPEAQAILDDVLSYTEVTPSGRGLHVIAEGKLPPGARRKGRVEVYETGRYFTMTGHHLPSTPVSIEKTAVDTDELLRRYLGGGQESTNGTARPIQPVDMDDLAILDKARHGPAGGKFAALFDRGDYSGVGDGSHSAGDFALCSRLAFWTGRDAARIDRIFRASALMRPKWDERHGAQTYGANTVARACAGCAEIYTPAAATKGEALLEPTAPIPYIEPLATFLAEEDPPVSMIFPDLLPAGVILLLHGEPRARKSLAAFELALAAATGTAPFGLERFRPGAPVGVTYIQEEDPRPLTRSRVRRLVQERCGATPPPTLYVSVRRGVDLDDPAWVERIIEDLLSRGVRLLVLDAARRLSTKTDEGPAKVRELMAALRSIVTRAGVSVIIVHHDIKPPTTGQDLRRRGQRASGGDWFAACECPVHVERVNEHESLVYPQDYKFSADPAPFTFSCIPDGRLIKALVGEDTTTDHAETAGERGKVIEWLRRNGPAAKTAMKKAGFGWATLTPLLEGLLRDGLVDEAPGRTAKSRLYFIIGEASSQSQDGSDQGRNDAL